jgi:hypothetical protein
MKNILELEALQRKVNDQIHEFGVANSDDSNLLELLYDSLTDEEVELVIARYCGEDGGDEEYDREYDEHLNEIRRYK